MCTTRHLPATAHWSQWNLCQLSPHPSPDHNWLDQKWASDPRWINQLLPWENRNREREK